MTSCAKLTGKIAEHRGTCSIIMEKKENQKIRKAVKGVKRLRASLHRTQPRYPWLRFASTMI